MKYRDKRGYERTKNSNLWHRKVAYHKIYLKNRSKYPLPFSEYEVHHKDGDKTNNHPDNLEILSPEEHIDRHTEMIEKKRLQLSEKELEITRLQKKEQNKQVAWVFIKVIIFVSASWFFFNLHPIVWMSLLFVYVPIALIFTITLYRNIRGIRRIMNS